MLFLSTLTIVCNIKKYEDNWSNIRKAALGLIAPITIIINLKSPSIQTNTVQEQCVIFWGLALSAVRQYMIDNCVFVSVRISNFDIH